MGMRGIIVAVVALVLAGCSRPPENELVYALRPPVVHALLKDVDFPYWAFGETGARADFDLDDEGDSLVWTMEDDGEDLIRYVARITPEGEGTRIAVTVDGPERGKYKQVGVRLKENPAIERLYVLVMKEEIAAKLENRPTRSDQIMPAMMMAAFATMGKDKAAAAN